MRSHVFSVFSARRVMSSRFPIGVGTMKSVPSLGRILSRASEVDLAMYESEKYFRFSNRCQVELGTFVRGYESLEPLVDHL